MNVGTASLCGSVLIVDDDIEALEEMADALQGYGLTVHTASHQDMAIKLAYKHRPALIIMEYLLRAYTGFELANDIRKFLPETQVIVISAFEDLSRIERTIKGVHSSVIAVLKKPLPINGIGRLINNQLDGRN
jgi:DNA-binding NtrC family response regulator